ncbi:MAG: hypothetical protein AAF604_24735 [Acidobacteriota bacterium]
MTLRKATQSLFISLAALLLLTLPLGASPGDQPPKECTHQETTLESASGERVLGLRVVLDEATGKLRPPTADEAKMFDVERQAERKNLVSLPGLAGGVFLLLGDGFHKQAVATIDASGEVAVTHDVVVVAPPGAETGESPENQEKAESVHQEVAP